jgi:tetraprenyl-beta-curcumene synthase
MRTLTPTSNGGAPAHLTHDRPLANRPPAPPALKTAAGQLQGPFVFAQTVARYVLRVRPCVRAELEHWRAMAAEIPDPVLREHAHASLGKLGNIEGAALFATLAPAAQRPHAIRALVAYQSAYNYLDTLSEQPSADPVNNADELHQALLIALHPSAAHADYYRHNPRRADGGYLTGLLDACRSTLGGLPSFATVAPAARAAAARIVDFQALNLTAPRAGSDPLQNWASEQTPAGSGVAWWESAAAAGSSLAVHALIAAAADPHLQAADVASIEAAYFPWVGALHSLLDSLVDRREDAELAQRSLLGYYPSPTAAARGLCSLARHARETLQSLPDGRAHEVILTAMCSYYLSAPQCHTAESQAIARALSRDLGAPLDLALALFGAKRLAAKLTFGSYT